MFCDHNNLLCIHKAPFFSLRALRIFLKYFSVLVICGIVFLHCICLQTALQTTNEVQLII